MSLEKTASPIRKFSKVTPWIYRGGQPDEQQFQELAKLGVTTVVSLRSGRFRAQLERQVVERSGMSFVHFPFTYFKFPDEEQIAAFLAVLDDQSAQPVFVHCLHGVDRTGYMIALYRMERMHWSLERAYNEMRSLGFHAFRLPHFKWELARYASRSQNQRNNPEHLPVSAEN
jgi:protein tyrosine/serine phosphatase